MKSFRHVVHYTDANCLINRTAKTRMAIIINNIVVKSGGLPISSGPFQGPAAYVCRHDTTLTIDGERPYEP